MIERKYSVDYVSGATGYGWSNDFGRLDEFEHFIDDHRHVLSAGIRVFDTELKKFIFYKRPLSDPEVDMLHAFDRDMRTTTRTW